MPIYEYECDKCGVRFEKQQRIADAPLTCCPECRGRVHRVLQPVGIIFKGSGFYVTDNRSSSSTALPGEKSAPDKPKTEDKTVDKPAKTESKAESGPDK